MCHTHYLSYFILFLLYCSALNYSSSNILSRSALLTRSGRSTLFPLGVLLLLLAAFSLRLCWRCWRCPLWLRCRCLLRLSPPPPFVSPPSSTSPPLVERLRRSPDRCRRWLLL
ncbi:hypothetical protein DQ04_13421020, partial [Trypanosoma grayi]|uniref:hypothetical protein n=1 Tax=Trypanosoma grayi TaxID=71804 RepID=UPI0004F4B410